MRHGMFLPCLPVGRVAAAKEGHDWTPGRGERISEPPVLSACLLYPFLSLPPPHLSCPTSFPNSRGCLPSRKARMVLRLEACRETPESSPHPVGSSVAEGVDGDKGLETPPCSASKCISDSPAYAGTSPFLLTALDAC